MGKFDLNPSAALFRLAGLTALALALTACQPEPRAAGEATLETANVQGISFNDPLPAKSSGAVEPAEAMEATESAVIPPPELTDPLAAEADALTVDLAAIPSATPVPTPEPTTDVAAATPQPAAEVASAPVAQADGEFTPISFKTLSGFKYIEPIPSEGEKPEDVEARRDKDQIPPEVKALNGINAIVEGWMVPMEVAEDGSVKSFVLVNTQPQCCFGDMQAMNEWVDVTMKGQNAEFNVDMPMKVYGQLEVGEKTEDGFVLSIYRMKADKVEL